VSTHDNKVKLETLAILYPRLLMRFPSPQQIYLLRLEKMEKPTFYPNDAPGWIGVMEDALRAGRQLVITAAGPESIGLFIARRGMELF
jgi:hypothetical protein